MIFPGCLWHMHHAFKLPPASSLSFFSCSSAEFTSAADASRALLAFSWSKSPITNHKNVLFINSHDHDDVDADVDVYHQSKSSRHQHAAEVQLQPWWLPLSACVAPMLPAGPEGTCQHKENDVFFQQFSVYFGHQPSEPRMSSNILLAATCENTHVITNIFRNKCHALAISWLQPLPHFLWTTTSSIHITHSFHILEPSCPLTFTCQMDLQGHHTQQYDSIVPPEPRVYFCIHPGKLAWNLKIHPWKRRNIYTSPILLGSMLVSGVFACSFCTRKTSPTSAMIHLSFLQLSSSSGCDFRGCYCSSLPAWCTGTRWPEIKESTFLLTNMSPPKITQGMFEAHFHFPRWDMLVPCRVFSLEGTRPSFDFHVIFSRSEGSGQLAVDVWEDSPPWCLR